MVSSHVGAGASGGDSYMELTNVDAFADGYEAHSIHMDSNSKAFAKVLVVTGGTFVSSQGEGLVINQYGGSFSTGVFDVSISGGALLNGNTAAVEVFGSTLSQYEPPEVNISVSGTSRLVGTRDGLSVNLTDADVLHIYGGARFGRNIKLTNSGVLQPYIKVAGVEQVSTGGKVRASGSEWRPTMDGARAEIGCGILWQLNSQHSLNLDYEASFGDKYDKPWGLTASYRYQF